MCDSAQIARQIFPMLAEVARPAPRILFAVSAATIVLEAARELITPHATLREGNRPMKISNKGAVSVPSLAPTRRRPPKTKSGRMYGLDTTGVLPADVRESARDYGWWAPPADVSQSLARKKLPPTLFGFVWRVSAWSQLRISVLAIAVFALNTAPLELQRRLLNATVVGGDIKLIVGLALVYAGVMLSEGLVKLLMNVYRSWVGEKAVRILRLSTSALIASLPIQRNKSDAQGIEVSLMIAEPEPIGAFVGISVSEAVLQVGVLLSVFGYMLYLQPWLAALSLAVFSPQLVFVPFMQRAINRRVQARITLMREAGVGVLAAKAKEVETKLRQEMRFEEIFRLNLGIFKLKFSMNFLMNLTHNFGKVMVLTLGGWYVINGQTEVGTVVAFVSGLHNVADPWGDLVNWYQDMMVTRTKYQAYVNAMTKIAKGKVSRPVA